MDISLRSGEPTQLATPCLVIGVFSDQAFSHSAAAVDQAGDGELSRRKQTGDIDCRTGKTTLLHSVAGSEADRILLVGCGKAEAFDRHAFYKTCVAAGKFLRDHVIREALSCLHELALNDTPDDAWKVRHSAIGIDHANYRYEATKKPKDEQPQPLAELQLLAGGEFQPAVDQARGIGAGYRRARELGNLPPNICNPDFLAQQAAEIAQRYDRCELEVLGRQEMADLQMGALLGVAQGSATEPKLIVLKYRGGGKSQRPTVLVGKGITFDTGGISLKPAENMDQMKYDMCGAASVIGAFEACAHMQLPVNLITVVAAVENMPDGASYRPGDVLTSMSGQTIEVLNTDAEGRLILCDALTYSERFEPESVIDVATLTGACVIALGHHASGLMSKHDDLAEELLAAGRDNVDRAWRLPLWDDYQSQLDTPFADMKNVGGMPAGSVTAGCFLSRFMKKQRWAHLDIAGSAWKWATQEGATGRPVGLLTGYLISKSAG